MELWFTEKQTSALQLSCRVKEVILHKESAHQEIAVLDTEPFGKTLALDGFIQVTLLDEYIYHEMIAHVPMVTHGDPRKVLIIGGGDGGSVREVLKHPGVEEVILVEIDSEVIEVCRRYFPETARFLDDPRVKVYTEDGREYLNHRPGEYDVIIVDSTEPTGPAAALFSRDFFRVSFRGLRENGVMVSQTESPFYNRSLLHSSCAYTRELFPCCLVYMAPVPSYPGGLWSFTLGSKSSHPCGDEVKSRAARVENCGYYSPEVHVSSFNLSPPFLT